MTAIAHHHGMGPLITLARQMPLHVATDGFLFLRHAETEGNRTLHYQAADQPLNAHGLGQAVHAAGLLTAELVDRIVASTMRRARETAAIVGNVLGRPVALNDGLRERWFGAVGESSADIDWAVDPPGGEPLAAFVARTRTAIEAALAPSDTALLVAHTGTLYVLAHVLDAAMTPEHWANANPLHFTRIGGRWQVAARERRSDVPIEIL